MGVTVGLSTLGVGAARVVARRPRERNTCTGLVCKGRWTEGKTPYLDELHCVRMTKRGAYKRTIK